jgi:hypothetical protein
VRPNTTGTCELGITICWLSQLPEPARFCLPYNGFSLRIGTGENPLLTVGFDGESEQQSTTNLNITGIRTDSMSANFGNRFAMRRIA